MTARRRSTLAMVAVVLTACATLRGAQSINKRGLLTRGESVPALKGFGVDGKVVTIDYRTQGKPTVVYVVQVVGGKIVGFGRTNEANFAAIVRQAGDRFKFVMLCPQDDGELLTYIATARAAWGTTPVTVVANVSEDLRQDMSLFAYPQTLVISVESRVLEAFQGAYTEQSLNAQPAVIERFFGVKLPTAQGR
jgi:hypothetical protein